MRDDSHSDVSSAKFSTRPQEGDFLAHRDDSQACILNKSLASSDIVVECGELAYDRRQNQVLGARLKWC